MFLSRRPGFTQQGQSAPAAALSAFPGSLLLHSPHFSCFYKQWQDLQIYKSINGLYSPISHFNNTRSCLQSVDSLSPVPEPGSVGWGTENRVGVGQPGGQIPSMSVLPGEPCPAAPVGSWQPSTAFQALSRNSRRRCPRCIW